MKTIVVSGHYDPLAVLEQVATALPPSTRQNFLRRWVPQIETDPWALSLSLEALLTEELPETPILLVVDDVEDILDKPVPGQRLPGVRSANGWKNSVVSVLDAFSRVRGRSRLVITSRIDFTAVDTAGKDHAATLKRIQLPPFDSRQRVKQWRASPGARFRERASSTSATSRAAPDLSNSHLPELSRRAMVAAAGYPGMQNLLTETIWADDFELAVSAVEAVEAFFLHGSASSAAGDVGELLRNMKMDVYRAALSPSEQAALRAFGIFGDNFWPVIFEAGTFQGLEYLTFPVPETVVDTVVNAFGVAHSSEARTRLVSLGLINVYRSSTSDLRVGGVAPNHFARNLVEPLDDAERRELAAAAIAALKSFWPNPDGVWPHEARSLEVVRLALLAGSGEEVQSAARSAFGYLVDQVRNGTAQRAAVRIGDAALRMANAAGVPLDLTLVRRIADAADFLGESQLHDSVLQLGRGSQGGDAIVRAQLDSAEGVRLARLGKGAMALTLLEGAAEVFRKHGQLNDYAITRSQTGRLILAEGDKAEAIRILKEEVYPAYKSLNDERSCALTICEIAEATGWAGDPDEWIARYHAEVLPAFQRSGDVHSIASALVQIGRVLYQKGEKAKAEKLWNEQIRVFERLGNEPNRIATMLFVADIKVQDGALDDAIGTYELAVKALNVMGDFPQMNEVLKALIAAHVGKKDKAAALRVGKERRRVLVELYGQRGRAIAADCMADISDQLGDPREALRIRQEEVLPALDGVDDDEGWAITLNKIAIGLLQMDGTARVPLSDVISPLARSMTIYLRMKKDKDIVRTGVQLAKLLHQAKRDLEATIALGRAEESCRRLNDSAGLKECEVLRQVMRKSR